MGEQAENREPSTTVPVSDVSLVAALKAGDDHAAEVLVRTHAGAMVAAAQRILGERSLAEDCAQEALINALRRIGGFEERSSLKTWLHRIVVNQALMKLRSRRAESSMSIDEWLPVFDENACRIEGPWPTLSTPDEICEREDRRALVSQTIEKLPENYRVVLKLRDIEELSTREVASALCIAEANVKVRLHRARSALKRLLEPLLKGEI